MMFLLFKRGSQGGFCHNLEFQYHVPAVQSDSGAGLFTYAGGTGCPKLDLTQLSLASRTVQEEAQGFLIYTLAGSFNYGWSDTFGRV